MSKNLTRKGLAFGALISLGASVIAGTPAFAADEVVFTPNTGTVYAAPINGTLTLNASLVSSVPAANIAQLKYKVVTDGTFVAKVEIASAGVTNTAHYTNGAIAANEFGTHALQAADLTGVGAAHYKPTTGAVYAPSTTPTTTAVNTIAVSIDSVANATAGTGDAITNATAVSKSVTVTAFVDANNNGAVDAGEFQTARTVNFLKYSEITATYTLTAPSAGATSVSAKATLTNINQEQLSKTVTAVFSKNGVAATAVATTVATGVYSATDSSATFSGGLAAGDVVGVQAKIDGAVIGSAEVTAAATARTIDAISTAVVAGDNALANGNVRDGGDFTIRAKVTKLDASSVAQPIAGVTGTVTFTTASATLSETVYVTINGTAYKTAAALAAASVAVTSNASGYLDVTVKTTGFTAGSSTITATYAVQNFAANNTATASVVTSKYSAVDVADTANVGVRRLATSATATVSYKVIDQYGVAPANDTFRLVLTGASAAYQPVVGGAASFTVTGAATNQAYTLALQKWDATSASYTQYDPTTGLTASTSAAEDGFTVQNAATASVATAGSLTATTAITADGNVYAYSGSYTALLNAAGSLTATTKLALSDQAFSSVDTRLDKKTAAPTLAKGYKYSTASAAVAGTTAGNAAVTITVTPKGSDVAATAIAAPVTVSGKGLLFQIGTSVFATDSISFIAASTGTDVKVYSHTAGDNVITITSATATKTVTLSYGTVAAEAATVVYGDLPAQAQAGRAVDLTAVVKDQWGNTVPGALVAFNNTGVGYVQSTSQVTSSATGVVSGRLIVLGSDLGTSTITATLDLATDVTVTKSIEFGVTDADVTVGGRAVYASVEFAKGKTVTVTVDGRRLYSKLFSTDAYTELKFTQKNAGKHTVTIRVSGGVVYSETVVTTK